MSDSIPYEIARLHLNDFKIAVQAHADDRDALVAIKGAVETEIALLKEKPYIRRFYVMKNIYLDGMIRQCKTAKKSSLQNPAGKNALVVVVEWIDETGETVRDQIATTKSLTDLMSGLWSKARKTGDDFPKVVSYWTCHDLSIIPEDIWDETGPVHNGMDDIPRDTEAHHELFSM